MAQLMPLPLTVSCFSKIQIGFTFLVPAHLGSPGKGPLNGGVCNHVIFVLVIFSLYLIISGVVFIECTKFSTGWWQVTDSTVAYTVLLVGRQEGHPVCKKTEW